MHYSYKGCWSTSLLAALLRESALHTVCFVRASCGRIPGVLRVLQTAWAPDIRMDFLRGT